MKVEIGNYDSFYERGIVFTSEQVFAFIVSPLMYIYFEALTRLIIVCRL